MKNLLYIGNALSTSGKTITTIETLSEHLKDIFFVKVASNKSHKILRLLDMIKLVVSNRSHTDFVLIDTYSTTNFYYALIISQLCRFFNLKYIPILHGGNLENRLKNYPKLSQLLFGNAHILVAPSEFLKSIFKTYGYNNIQHIPNTIDLEKYEYSSREIEGIKLLWVRSFSSIYNPELAVNVLHQLNQAGHLSELTMIGPDVDGSLIEVKKLANELNLNVKFLGKLTKEQWITEAKNYNFFINTTNFDNTPVSVIEAMALGLPIVSTNVGGLPYIITHNTEGILVPPDNIEAMADAIINLSINNKLRQNITENARRKVENFDWGKVKSKWISLLS